MANIAGGSVVWVLDAQTGQFESAVISARNKAKQLGDDVENVGKKSFSNMASSASGAFNSVADGIANITKRVALLTIGAGGIGSVFLKSAAELQQTSKSMEVLTGNTEVANKLFAQLADYAAKTPFEFPQIAKAGKTLLGFGIESDKVFSQVQMLGDLAAATGADFESLAVVFGQVNATGRLMGQDALQLINNNIPITSILAKKLGTSVQEVKKQMEAGAISADLFNEALREQTSAGGFAFKGTEVLAQSLNGRLSTLKDTVLEFGRNLLGVKVDPKLGLVIEQGGLFDRFSNAIPKITKSLQEMTPKIKAAFDFLINNGQTVVSIIGAIGAVFVAAKVAAFGFYIATLPISGTVVAIVAGVVALVGVLAFLQLRFNILGKAAKALEPVFNVIKGVFSDLWTSIKELGAVLAKELAPVFEFVSRNADTFKKILIGVVALAFAPLLLAIGTFIASMKLLSIVIGFIADHFQTIKKVVIGVIAVAFLPLTIAIAAVVLAVRHGGDVIRWFGGVFKKIGSVIAGVVADVVGFLTSMFNVFQTIFSAIWGFVSPILNFIKNLFIIVFGGILLIVLTVLTVIKDTVIAVFTTIWSYVSTALNAIWNVVSTVWNAIWKVIQTITQFIWDRIVNAFNFYRDIIVSVFQAVYNFVSGIWNAIYGVISGVVQSLMNFFAPAASWLLQRGKDIINGLVNGIRAVAGNVWGAVKSAADQIGQFFSGAGRWLYDVGRAIIQGMVNGIKSMAGAAANAAGDVANGVKNKVKGLLGIHSPSKVFMELGKNVGQGFAGGIDSTMGMVESTMKNMSTGVESIGADINPGGNAGNQQTVTIGTVVLNTPEAAKSFFDELNQDTINLGMGLTPVQGA